MTEASERTKLIDVIRRSLGGSMVDIELDPEDYNLAIDKAIETYRQLSENSMEESYLFLDLTEETNIYILSDEIQEVKQIFRRSVGTPGLGGTEVDPFELAYTNVYILQAGRASGLATYDFFTHWQEQAGKMFGFFLNFHWEPATKKLEIIRRPLGNETVLLWIHNAKPESILLQDVYSKPWLRDWSIAECKMMMGNAYRKYNNIAGPAGGTTLPGDQLMSEAKEEFEQLRQKLRDFEDGSQSSWFVIG